MVSLLIPFLGVALAAPDFSEVQKLWRQFKSCSRYQGSEELLSCASPLLAKNLGRSQKTRLVRFIDMEIPFSELKECAENAPVLPAHRNPKELLYCLNVMAAKTPSHGYVLFVQEMGELKIQTIKFKWLPMGF